MCSVQRQYKGGGRRPLRPPSSVVSFVLALNKAHALAPNTAHVLRLNKAEVLALNKAHVLRLDTKICPIFTANTKGGGLRPPRFVVSFALAVNTAYLSAET